MVRSKPRMRASAGEPPFDPAMMTALLLYGYCNGVYSSRRIAKAARERVDFLSIVGLDPPDFRTVSDFRKRHLKALAGLFGQVLKLCEQAGLVKLGHVALDGTKIKANAIFHFANGPLLQLVAQKLALAHPGYETGLTSAAIIITQLATIPMALLVTRANALGRKPLLIIAFAAVPIRGLLCASFDNPSWLLGVQLLDGMGAGMYDALLPLLLADMMRGTGRYSLARGMLGTIQGIGGSTSLGAAGFIVTAFGYNAAFLTLAAVAMIALLVIVVALPETRPTPGRLDQPSLGGGPEWIAVRTLPPLISISQPLCFRPRPIHSARTFPKSLTQWVAMAQRALRSDGTNGRYAGNGRNERHDCEPAPQP